MFANVNFFLLVFFGVFQLMCLLETQATNTNWQSSNVEVEKSRKSKNDERAKNIVLASEETTKSNSDGGSDSTNSRNRKFISYKNKGFLKDGGGKINSNNNRSAEEYLFMKKIGEKMLESEITMNTVDGYVKGRQMKRRETPENHYLGHFDEVENDLNYSGSGSGSSSTNVDNVLSELHQQDVIDLATVENIKAEQQSSSKSVEDIEQLPVPQSLVASSSSNIARELPSQYKQYLKQQQQQHQYKLQQQQRQQMLQRQYAPIMADSDNDDGVGGGSDGGDGSDGIEQNGPLPVFPERNDAVYFIVAVIGGAKVWARTLARTLMEMGAPFGSPLGPPLRPLYVDLPVNGRFSVNVLTSLCQQTDGVPLAGVVVIGDGQSARAIAMSGHSMQIPVLWARGGTANIRSTQSEEEANLQTILQPSAREILEAIRALFLQTHWHSFFVLSDVEATMVLAGNEGLPLKRPPLRPTILPLPPTDGNVFRQLAEISRSTRGIVLLLCNLVSARNVMSEAKRLNMAGGHFIWLWADTSSTAEFFDVNKEPVTSTSGAPSSSVSSSSSMSSSLPSGAQQSRSHLHSKMHAIPMGSSFSSANDGKIHFDYVAPAVNIPAVGQKFANDLIYYKNDAVPANPFHPNGEVTVTTGSDNDIRQGSKENNININLNVDSSRESGMESVEKADHYTIGLNSAGHPSIHVDHTMSEKNEETVTREKIEYDDNEDEEYSYEDKTKEDNSYQIDDDGKNFQTYYKYLQQRNDSEVNRNQMKPKRTSSSSSSDSMSSTLHFGFNGSSSHVLFHHFKDFPVGLLALRPRKMTVDRNFIRSAIRLFASTWAQVQIDDDINDEDIEENLDPYGKRRIKNRNVVQQMESTMNAEISISNQRRRRRRSKRRRRRRRELEQFYNYTKNSRQVNNYFNKEEITTNSENNISGSSENNNYNTKKNMISNNNKNINNLISKNDKTNFTLKLTPNTSRDFFLNEKNLNFYKVLQDKKTNQNKTSGLKIVDLDSRIEKRSQLKPKSNRRATTIREEDKDKVVKRDASNTWWSVGNSGKKQQPNWYDLDGYGGAMRSMTNSEEHDVDGSLFELYRKTSVTPCFRGGCFGTASRADVQRAELFAGALKKSTAEALAGDLSIDGLREHPLITNFEILNLVPDAISSEQHEKVIAAMRRERKQRRLRYPASKWRRVGLISGRSVHLDTIVWPGGDIVVSGLSAKSRTIFRIVTALAPPFVMQSELDEDGMCLRGLPCHRLMPNNHHNLTLMFNAIETKHRFNEDIVEHGGRMGSSNHDDLGKSFDHSLYETKCCYGLSMDLLDNIATELEFEFHLYLVHDDLFGSRFSSINDFTWTWPSSTPAKKSSFGYTTTTANGRRSNEQNKQDSIGSNSKRTTATGSSTASTKNKQQTKTFEESKEEQSSGQQRRYHSPEGRTKTRRHSGSFERENSNNKNNNKNTETFNNKNESPTAIDVTTATTLTATTNATTNKKDGDGGKPLNDWINARRSDGYDESTSTTNSSSTDANVDAIRRNVNENDNGNHRYQRLRRQNDDGDWPKTEQEAGTAADDYDYDFSDNSDDDDKRNYRKRFARSATLNRKKPEWNGIIGDLISGAADMSFAPLTVSRSRAEVIDFSAPYFHGSVSLLAAPQSKSEIPLLAFLLPFSPELWIAIFTSLNVTAIAVAIYEWLSPFGLNPWGRQRSKNFSMSSALWVMWGLLCGHLVAFKAPKSWPNKFLINVWGGFSVIFIASYTANIAALIAGLFFHNSGNTPEVSLLTQRVGAPISSATEAYLKQYRPHEWEHIKKFSLHNIEEGIQGLKNGSLDLLIGDTPVLDYYRAIDHGCNLLRLGEIYVEDTYAIGMKKGFPLKDSISALIAKYSSNGYLDILADKWYGGLPCFKMDSDIIMPRPLGVAAVAGVFLLLGLGMTVGVIILIFEHWFYKYMLPKLRHKPKGTVWRSRNIMFFSQKLYRFINCVELVSPHHAARELVDTLRQGQIASLFQKSIKRKEDEQRRRRKSKAQFFEMIQEIRRVQQAERLKSKLEVLKEAAAEADNTIANNTSNSKQIPEIITPHSRSPKVYLSPRPKLFSARSSHKRTRSNSSTLSVRRCSNDSILSDRLDTIGRRLSRDLTNSPPDFANRKLDTLSPTSAGSIHKFNTFSGQSDASEKIEETKFDTFSHRSNKVLTAMKKHQNRRIPLNFETYKKHKCDLSDDDEAESKDDDVDVAVSSAEDDEQKTLIEYTEANTSSLKSVNSSSRSPSVGFLPVVREGQVTATITNSSSNISTNNTNINCQEDRAQAILRERMHEELITKYGESKYESLPSMRRSSKDGNITPPQTASQRTSFRTQVRSPAAALKRNRQRSLDGLEQRPRLPSPPRIIISANTKTELKGRTKATKPPRRSPKSNSRANAIQTTTATTTTIPNRQELSLDRIKRNDTLRLYSSSAETEIIHENHLSKSLTERSLEPP